MNGLDWNSALVRGIVEALLPVLVTSITSWVLILASKAWKELQLMKPDVVDQIARAAVWVVPVIEQLKSNGVIPDNETAKKRAVELVEKYLLTLGVDIDLDKYAEIIDNSIEGALKEYKLFEPKGL